MRRKFGFLIYENAKPLDVIGPWEVFSLWKTVLQAPIELILIAEHEGLIHLDSQITLKAHKSFVDAPKLDYLLVPGGRGRTQQVKNEKLLHFLREKERECDYVLSVCTGMFLLAAAGLLKNQPVTTYWRALPELRQNPDLHLIEKRIVKKGKFWTAGGITSGIDLALDFIAEIGGKETAGKVQLLLEYFPEQKIYCDLQTAEQLPPYSGRTGPVQAKLPAYIEKLLS